MPRKKTIEDTTDAIPLFDEGKASKPVVEKKTRKKSKPKIWIRIKGWTRSNPIFSMVEVTEADLTRMNSLIKAIKAYKGKDDNWAADVADVYDKYPKIRPKDIDFFEAYVPTGIDLCYMDESVSVVKPGSADSIESITVIRGTEEEII